MEAIKNFYHALNTRSRVTLIVAATVILVGTAATLWWALTPRDRLLFGNVPKEDAAEIAATLNEWKVPHRFTADGAGILVNEEQLHETRMRLVSAGVPSGGHVGYELFNDNDFGVTEFAQRINYQRALQGELERTIRTLPGVRDVRVHLSIRRAGLFLDDQAQSKASVAISMLSGATLERRQISGIRNLVAFAVEGLQPEAVVIVGPSGLQIGSGAATGSQASAEEQIGSAHEMASLIESRLRHLLEDTLPGQKAAVSVDVRMNFDRVHRTSERLLAQPDTGQGLIVKRSSNGAPPAVAGSPSTMLSEQVEYEHGREREEMTRMPGTVERISVAVVLPAGISISEQERLRRLLRTAAGIDATRGDSFEIAMAPALLEANKSDATNGEGRAQATAAERATSGGWRSWSPALIFPALLIWLAGIAMGALIGRRYYRGRTSLSSTESENIAQQARAWLTGTST